MSWKLTAWLKVSCEAGCQIAVRSPSQCIWSVSVTPPPAAVDGAALVAGALAAGAALAGGAVVALGAAAELHAEKASTATVRIARPRVRMVPPPRSLGRLLLGRPTIGVQRRLVNEISLQLSRTFSLDA